MELSREANAAVDTTGQLDEALGLAEHLPPDYRTTFVSFSEGGWCGEFLRTVRGRGFDGVQLAHDTPHLIAATDELTALLRERAADMVFCHGYKANLLGRVAARRAGLPVVAVSRGWTRENLKVRTYELLDRWHLRFLDRVVCVSEGQAAKVRRVGATLDRARFDALIRAMRQLHGW